MQDIAQNSRIGWIHWCPQPLLVSASRVQLFFPSDQPWDCSSVLDFLCLLLKNWYQLLAQPSQWRVFIYIYIFFFLTYMVMGLRGRGNRMNVSQPLVVYSFVSHWSPLFLWLEHALIDCSLVIAWSHRLFSSCLISLLWMYGINE